jgi:L-alanine-DL-glutamate epimerase-like enolase superfamily enzyme
MSESPSIRLQLLDLPLRYEWKLSRNSTVSKTNGIIRLEWQGICSLGEAAPNIRYQETPERLYDEFHQQLPALLTQVAANPEKQHKLLSELPVCQALKTALDIAFSDLQARLKNKSIAALHGLSEARPRKICYTIPVMEAEEIPAFIERENLHRFEWLKIKVNAETALRMTETVLNHFDGSIAIDGNEAWKDKDAVLSFSQNLPSDRIIFLEQPFPSSMRDAYPWLKERSPLEIWGDESVLGESEPEFWQEAFSGINVKLMKTGSIRNAVRMLKDARSAGLKTMIGCMVETSIGIATAMQLESLADYMDLDGFLLLENEPFGRVSEMNGVVSLTSKA